MRFLLINQYYKPDTAATGQLLADLAESLVARRHEVHVVCGRSLYGGGALPPAGDETLQGVHVHRVATTGFGRRILIGRMTDYFSFYVTAAWRALWLPKVDVCVSLTTPPFISLVGLVLSKLKGTQNVIWVMDIYPDVAVAYDVLRKNALLYRLLTRLNRLLYGNAAAVISLGEVMTERLQALGAPSSILHTVHNWVPGEMV